MREVKENLVDPGQGVDWEGIHVTSLWVWSLQLLPAGKRLAIVEVNAVEKVDIQDLELKVLCAWKKTKARRMLVKEQLRGKVRLRQERWMNFNEV